jgi:hypothetical protein
MSLELGESCLSPRPSLRGVIELTEVAEHIVERSGLRLVRLDPVFIREDHCLLTFLALDVLPHHSSIGGPRTGRRYLGTTQRGTSS